MQQSITGADHDQKLLPTSLKSLSECSDFNTELEKILELPTADEVKAMKTSLQEKVLLAAAGSLLVVLAFVFQVGTVYLNLTSE